MFFFFLALISNVQSSILCSKKAKFEKNRKRKYTFVQQKRYIFQLPLLLIIFWPHHVYFVYPRLGTAAVKQSWKLLPINLCEDQLLVYKTVVSVALHPNSSWLFDVIIWDNLSQSCDSVFSKTFCISYPPFPKLQEENMSFYFLHFIRDSKEEVSELLRWVNSARNIMSDAESGSFFLSDFQPQGFMMCMLPER